MVKRSLSSYEYEVVSISTERFDVEKDSSLYRILSKLEEEFSRISSNTDFKKIGFSVYEKSFTESLLNLNTIYKNSFKYNEFLKYPYCLPYTLENDQNNLDDRFCRLKFQESILKLCIDFISLYKEVDANEDSNLLEEYQDLCEKIYKECFLDLINRESLNLDLDLYNWLIENGVQTEPHQYSIFSHDTKQSYTYTKELAEHFSTHGEYIVKKIIESVSQSSFIRKDFNGDNYTEYVNSIRMANPLANKYVKLAVEVDDVVSSFNQD